MFTLGEKNRPLARRALTMCGIGILLRRKEAAHALKDEMDNENS